MRGKLRYTPTHVVPQEPMKSARRAKSFRLVSDGFVHRSRTITRTISALTPAGCAAITSRATPYRRPILRYGLQIHRGAAAFRRADLDALLLRRSLIEHVAGGANVNASAARLIAKGIPSTRSHPRSMFSAKRGDGSCARVAAHLASWGYRVRTFPWDYRTASCGYRPGPMQR
jgi:hypothetical protein